MDRVLKILWVKVGGLVPLDTGGKIRSYHILRELSCRHDVTFFTSYAEHRDDVHGELDHNFARVMRYSLRVPQSRSFGHLAQYAGGFFSKRPHQFVRYHSPQVTLELRQLLEKEKFDVVVCDFLAAAQLIPWHFPTPKVLFTHNVEALIWKRHCAVARNPLWKAICWREYCTTAFAERRYLNLADHVLTVSDTDREVFAQTIDPAKITVIPTGVDSDFFRPRAGEEQPNTLVFTGSMDYMPNEDGICYFVEQILPRVRLHLPNVALLVVGRRPSPRLLKLATMTPGVEVTGSVEDIRPYVQRGSVYVVPLRVGSGTRLKIFEAMAMGKAVVSTSVGAEGLPVRPEQNILIADTPDEFANAVVRLIADRNLRIELGRAARELVVQKHSWGSVAQHFELTLERLLSEDSMLVESVTPYETGLRA
jgi:polysaccharide biosynthesis protein PslH